MENKLVPIEHNGVRVITTELLAQVYETDTNNIKNNFNNHKDNFREGVHYYLLKGDELRAFKREVNNIDLVAPNVNQLYLWTERGANRQQNPGHAQSVGAIRQPGRNLLYGEGAEKGRYRRKDRKER